MKYANATAFRQALDQRIKNEVTSTGLGVGRLRKRVAFELFLRPPAYCGAGSLGAQGRARTGFPPSATRAGEHSTRITK